MPNGCFSVQMYGRTCLRLPTLPPHLLPSRPPTPLYTESMILVRPEKSVRNSSNWLASYNSYKVL